MDVLELDMAVAMLVDQARYPCLESGNGRQNFSTENDTTENYRKSRKGLKYKTNVRPIYHTSTVCQARTVKNQRLLSARAKTLYCGPDNWQGILGDTGQCT